MVVSGAADGPGPGSEGSAGSVTGGAWLVVLEVVPAGAPGFGAKVCCQACTVSQTSIRRPTQRKIRRLSMVTWGYSLVVCRRRQ